MLNRRQMLRGLGLAACSAAAHPWLTTVTLAGSDGGRPLGDHRLIVVILRGAMDGLDVVRPVGDPLLGQYRPTLLGKRGTGLDGFWELHPAMAPLMPLWDSGDLGFVHATSTPYRTSAAISTDRICWRQARAWMCRCPRCAMAG